MRPVPKRQQVTNYAGNPLGVGCGGEDRAFVVLENLN